MDFVGQDGQVMIFYAAKLSYYGITVPYTSSLLYDLEGKISHKSRFKNIHMPVASENIIRWSDPAFDRKCTWRSGGLRLQQRLFESPKGSLQWICDQPLSNVLITAGDKEFNGRGYVEHLILTLPPWNIPMKELRWGHFISKNDYLVWIQIKGESDANWVWYNGMQVKNCDIGNEALLAHDGSFELTMKDQIVLESGTQIHSVVNKILKYIPKFTSWMPAHFLNAENHMWKSSALLRKKDEDSVKGCVIHEWVNFNTG